MPYIKRTERSRFEQAISALSPETAGELNYIISSIVRNYVHRKGEPSYANYNEAIGVAECVKLEYYRRIVSIYEDVAKDKNGDIFK